MSLTILLPAVLMFGHSCLTMSFRNSAVCDVSYKSLVKACVFAHARFLAPCSFCGQFVHYICHLEAGLQVCRSWKYSLSILGLGWSPKCNEWKGNVRV